MARLVRDNVGLHVVDHGTGPGVPLLLVHGIACDHRYLAPQLRYFANTRRTVAVDLRGHGRSDVPADGYSIEGYAEDLAWLCDVMALDRPVVVGHSLGGLVGLQLAARHPELVRGVVMLDSVLLAGPTRVPAVRTLLNRLRSDDYATVLREYFNGFFSSVDDPRRRQWILDQIVRVPPSVTIPVWEHGTFEFDDAAAVRACRVPLLYVDAGTPNVNLGELQRLAPTVVIGRTVGSGHFHQLEVPDQANAMISRYLATQIDR